MEKEEKKVFTLRIPKSLHFQIEKSANEESRTLNSWFLNIARQYLQEQENAKK
jgi:predicted HicB family RNase H-like nuclease